MLIKCSKKTTKAITTNRQPKEQYKLLIRHCRVEDTQIKIILNLTMM